LAHVGISIDCADGTVRLCFPILSAWIADHMENVALHALTTNACPKCEVPTNELGTNARTYRARDYARYQRDKPENQTSGSETDDDHVMNLGIGQNIFHELDRVSASDLYKLDLLHTIYRGLFKHIMDRSSLRGGRGPGKHGPPALFPALPRSTAWGGVSFSAFPAPAPAQAPAPPIPWTGPR